MALDARTRATQVLETLYPDPTVRAARVEELGETGLMALGNSVLRQDDYSRNMNEVTGLKTAAQTAEAAAQALYQSNKEWFDQKQAELTELDTLRARVAGGTPTPTPTPTPDAPTFLTKAEYEASNAATERGAVAFFTELNRLSLDHFQKFGEILDTDTLLRDKRVQQIGLLGVYREVHKPQLDKRAAEQAAAAEEKIREDERQKMRVAAASQHHPYPVRGNEPSTLDGLQAPADQRPKVATVDDMTAEYARLSALRTGVPA